VIATDVYLIVLRILHIGAGVAWAGGVFLFVVFVQPSAAAIAPQGAPFIRELVGSRRLIDRILTIAAVSIVGGALLYWELWRDAGGLGDFLGTSYGVVLTIGALAALTAFVIGLFGTRPAVQRMLALGAQMAQAEGPPPPELATQMQAVQGRLKVLARTGLGLLTVAVLAMATARYW
jgi:uncharacterized membrane protein